MGIKYLQLITLVIRSERDEGDSIRFVLSRDEIRRAFNIVSQCIVIYAEAFTPYRIY